MMVLMLFKLVLINKNYFVYINRKKDIWLESIGSRVFLFVFCVKFRKQVQHSNEVMCLRLVYFLPVKKYAVLGEDRAEARRGPRDPGRAEHRLRAKLVHEIAQPRRDVRLVHPHAVAVR